MSGSSSFFSQNGENGTSLSGGRESNKMMEEKHLRGRPWMAGTEEVLDAGGRGARRGWQGRPQSRLAPGASRQEAALGFAWKHGSGWKARGARGDPEEQWF